MTKKDLKIVSRQLVAVVDFIKWTSTFGEGAIRQMEVPMSGVRLAPALSRLFGLAKDDSGAMLVMHESEGGWLAELPLECAFIGYDDELLIVTREFKLLDVPFTRVGIGLVVPDPDLRQELAEQLLLGFGLLQGQEASSTPAKRVNQIVPLYTPERYAEAKRAQRTASGNLFSAAS